MSVTTVGCLEKFPVKSSAEFEEGVEERAHLWVPRWLRVITGVAGEEACDV